MGERPGTVEEAAAAVRAHVAAVRSVRPRGGGTKLGWGGLTPAEREGSAAGNGGGRPSVDLDMRGLDRIVEHNEGDFTAVLEAGVRLADAQAVFGRAGQMLALDPPLGDGAGATIGGVVATADSGPLRHRYGGVRDLVLGATVVLSDGTIASSGGKVIKNVAGYDLAKLFAGSHGTLGLIARVSVRLHPLPSATVTVAAEAEDPDRLGAAVVALARRPLELEAFDVAWSDGAGRVLLRFAGSAAAARAAEALAALEGLESPRVHDSDDDEWRGQRAAQRAGPGDGCVVRVAALPTDLPTVLRAADAAGGRVVARAGLGLSWIALPAGADVASLRRSLAPHAVTVLDGGERAADPWPAVDAGALAVMRRIKARFDPARAFRPGAFAGGI